MSRVLDCAVCQNGIEKFDDEYFNYEGNGTGPYCDWCWILMERIVKLENQVDRLERSSNDRMLSVR